MLDAVPQCPQVGPKEDPHKMGLVLEWVYGTIVSTAEKARDGAKRALGELSFLHHLRPYVMTASHNRLLTVSTHHTSRSRVS